jgi:hypothetical protein
MHESLLLYKKLVNNRVKYPNIANEYQYILI